MDDNATIIESQALPATGWTWVDNAAVERAAEIGPTAFVVYVVLARDDAASKPADVGTNAKWQGLEAIA